MLMVLFLWFFVEGNATIPLLLYTLLLGQKMVLRPVVVVVAVVVFEDTLSLSSWLWMILFHCNHSSPLLRCPIHDEAQVGGDHHLVFFSLPPIYSIFLDDDEHDLPVPASLLASCREYQWCGQHGSPTHGLADENKWPTSDNWKKYNPTSAPKQFFE